MENLIEKYKNSNLKAEFNKFKSGVKGFTTRNDSLNLKAGDVVSFLAGYDRDIRYTSEILGFDKDGNAFMLWDCYWFAINLPERLYSIPSTVNNFQLREYVANELKSIVSEIHNRGGRFYKGVYNDLSVITAAEYPPYMLSGTFDDITKHADLRKRVEALRDKTKHLTKFNTLLTNQTNAAYSLCIDINRDIINPILNSHGITDAFYNNDYKTHIVSVFADSIEDIIKLDIALEKHCTPYDRAEDLKDNGRGYYVSWTLNEWQAKYAELTAAMIEYIKQDGN